MRLVLEPAHANLLCIYSVVCQKVSRFQAKQCTLAAFIVSCSSGAKHLTALRKSSGPAEDQPPSTDAKLRITEELALLGLAGIKGVGFWTLRKLTKRKGGLASIFRMRSAERVRKELALAGAKLAADTSSDWTVTKEAILRRAAQLQTRLDDQNVHLILRGSSDYPERLQFLEDPPDWLFVQGNIGTLHQPTMAVVGTRKPTDDGEWLAKYVGACLHQLQCVTVSGLANGIDQAIHEASLANDVPSIAVLGTGIFQNYPRGSEPLRDKLIEAGGAIVTEYLPTQSYSAENFVRRNRIQAALGSVLVPVEWAVRSGTAHTVRFATQLERPIACMRMPQWDEMRTPFRTIKYENAALFTVPGDEAPFLEFIANALAQPVARPAVQHDFFSSD